ncbi:MAG: hypothetical protein JWQ76_1732, partial [Ramlibacter sp.]|nr:hypothetical protein [Ramlibacter sp.]
AAFAADEAQRIEELEKKLRQSMVLIEQLSNRLNQLEAAKAPVAARPEAAEAVNAQAARIDRLEQTVTGISDTSAKTRDLGIPLHGFADVGYAKLALPIPGRKAGFAVGNLDLYMTPEFGDRVRSIVELVFEYGPEGGGVATDLERLQFGYTFSDALTLWVGRFHTPYGYWNAAFHHGQQIQTAASRPRLVEFEDRGGILPAHAVGLLASGNTRVGSGRLQYDAYLANGDGIQDRVLDLNAGSDDNANKLVGGNVRYAFSGPLEGLTLGLHAFQQRVTAYDADKVALGSTRVNMFGGFGVYEHGDWEVIGEYYRFHDTDLSAGTGTHASWAGFLQAGYTVAGRWTPYARVERAELDQGDTYFAAQESGRSYVRGVLGVRYDLNPSAALKLELDRMRQDQPDGTVLKGTGARLQFAVRF